MIESSEILETVGFQVQLHYIFIRDYIDPGSLEWDHFGRGELNYFNTRGTQISTQSLCHSGEGQ